MYERSAKNRLCAPSRWEIPTLSAQKGSGKWAQLPPPVHVQIFPFCAVIKTAFLEQLPSLCPVGLLFGRKEARKSRGD